jgi:hypothetical protein
MNRTGTDRYMYLKKAYAYASHPQTPDWSRAPLQIDLVYPGLNGDHRGLVGLVFAGPGNFCWSLLL